jgi:hypothetical protein
MAAGAAVAVLFMMVVSFIVALTMFDQHRPKADDHGGHLLGGHLFVSLSATLKQTGTREEPPCPTSATKT